MTVAEQKRIKAAFSRKSYGKVTGEGNGGQGGDALFEGHG